MSCNDRRLTFSGRAKVACLIIFTTVVLLAQSVAAQNPSLPTDEPVAEVGLEIFADRCADCHGPTGEGDGELAVNLPIPPASFADPEYRKSAMPGIMFDTIFNGRLEAQMPPFGPGTENSNPISETNIWNLVAAVYSLSTPAEQLAGGQAVYEAKCASCHTEPAGGDDAQDAGNLNDDRVALTDLSYWFARSNEMIFAELTSRTIPEHDIELSEDELWAAIDYARSFSYAYVDPFAPLPPIDSATISGAVFNGSTNEILTDATARLRAFTPSFEETLNITTTVGADGQYRFDLEMVPPDWIYLTSIVYGGLSFSSDAGQLSNAQTTLELPVTVFEQTTNPDAVTIDQLHLILEFVSEDRLAVNELYVFSNREAAVFVGETGRTGEGTVLLSLPEAAENIAFERTLGSFESTIPATEMIQTSAGWADTLPLRPGQGGSNLIVRYELSYDDGVDLSHQILYDAANATVILPDVGVELDDAGWAFRGTQQMSGGSAFLTYDRSGVSAGSRLDLDLSGRVRQSSSIGSANAVAPRNQTSELLIGAGVFLIAAAAVVYTVRSWGMTQNVDPHLDGPEEREDIDFLLRAIVNLDDEYENGELDEEEYSAQREGLKAELRSLWE